MNLIYISLGFTESKVISSGLGLTQRCKLLTCACICDMFFHIIMAKIPLSGQERMAYSIDGWPTILVGARWFDPGQNLDLSKFHFRRV